MKNSVDEAKTPLVNVSSLKDNSYYAGPLWDEFVEKFNLKYPTLPLYDTRDCKVYVQRAVRFALTGSVDTVASTSDVFNNPERDLHSQASQPESASSISSTLAEIRERLFAASPGPWRWRQDYEMPDGSKHWELSNPQSDRERKTIDGSLILEHDSPTFLGRPCETLPNWQLIANAPTDIDTLLGIIDSLQAEKAKTREGCRAANELIIKQHSEIKNLELAASNMKAAIVKRVRAFAATRSDAGDLWAGRMLIQLATELEAIQLKDEDKNEQS